MHIGILTVRNRRYHPNQRLIEAAERAGHRVSLLDAKRWLSHLQSQNCGLNSPIPKEDLDSVLPRFGATINDYALTLVRHLELAGLRVINGYEAILLARDKFRCLQTLVRKGIPVPRSWLVRDQEGFKSAVRGLGGYPVVAKMLNSRQGRGVMLVESDTMAGFIMDNLKERGKGLLVQEYIPPQGRRDVRVFALGDRIVAAMELEPDKGDFRSNIHLRGKGKTATLETELVELALGSSNALGLEISGTDIILDRNNTPMVIEVNYSPGFRGLETATGLDIASEIIDYVARTPGGTLCRSVS